MLRAASFAGPIPGQFVFSATGINFNSVGDTAIKVSLPAGYTRYTLGSVRIGGASGSLTTATCGLFTGPGGSGTAIVTSGSAITVNTASDGTNNNTQSLTVNNGNTQSYTVAGFPTLYFRVTNPEGSPVTANIQFVLIPQP